jgi:AAA domain
MLPADVEERIGEALTPFGYQRPEPKREYDYHDFCDDVHDRAMTNFDAWVPSLGIPVFRSANGKYRGVATWRGGENYNVGFSPQGIKDWVSEEGFSPSGVVERALGIDSWDSDNWLRERLGLQPLPKVVFTFRKPGDRQKTLGVSASDLLEKDVGAPEFIVDGWLQNRKVGLLLGEDGAGKSFLLLDLAIAVATGGNWLGNPTKRAPVLFVSAEEEERDIKKRLQVALTHGLSARTGNLHIIGVDTIDQDYGGAVLAEVDEKTRKISMTKLWEAVVRKVESVNPKLLILEPLNELFDGDEMVRRQARQFIDNLRRLARKRDMPVLLGAHPSNASMNERRPGAGTNGWNAAVRMRWWLEVIRDNGDATNERKLHRMKVTGARNDRVPIDLVVGEGGWLVLKYGPKVEDEEGGFGAVLAKIESDKLAFMDAIEKRFALGVFLTASPASPKGYAPRAIINDEGGRDRAARIKANERIMGDLFTEGRIASKQYGPKSKDKWRLEVVSRTPLLHSEKENKDDEHKD